MNILDLATTDNRSLLERIPYCGNYAAMKYAAQNPLTSLVALRTLFHGADERTRNVIKARPDFAAIKRNFSPMKKRISLICDRNAARLIQS